MVLRVGFAHGQRVGTNQRGKGIANAQATVDVQTINFTFVPADVVIDVGDTVRWTFGALDGTAIAAADGSVTIPQLPLTTRWTTLVIERN